MKYLIVKLTILLLLVAYNSVFANETSELTFKCDDNKGYLLITFKEGESLIYDTESGILRGTAIENEFELIALHKMSKIFNSEEADMYNNIGFIINKYTNDLSIAQYDQNQEILVKDGKKLIESNLGRCEIIEKNSGSNVVSLTDDKDNKPENDANEEIENQEKLLSLKEEELELQQESIDQTNKKMVIESAEKLSKWGQCLLNGEGWGCGY